MIDIRPAAAEDCRLVWDWANDPTVRAVSFHPLPIPWIEHQLWFAAKLADSRCRLFIVVDDGRPIGQIRFEIEGDQAEVHISLRAGERGRGRGAAALRAGCARLRQELALRKVVALVKRDNVHSIRAFEKAGFVRSGAVIVENHDAERMVLESAA